MSYTVTHKNEKLVVSLSNPLQKITMSGVGQQGAPGKDGTLESGAAIDGGNF